MKLIQSPLFERKVKKFEKNQKLRRLKASIPFMYTNSDKLYNIRHFAELPAGMIHLKKPSGGPKGLLGPPCHGAGEVAG